MILFPAIDLKDAVDEFVRSIPGSKQGGYKDPSKDPIARTRLVEGFKKARDGDLPEAGKQLKLVDYTATLYIDSGTGREVVILQEKKDVLLEFFSMCREEMPEIVALGKEVNHLAAGERVTAMPVAGCGHWKATALGCLSQ